LGRQGHSHARIACCIVAPAVAPDRIPLSLLAIAGGLLVGTINLVESDDENRLHLRPWLAALFIIPDRRRQGIGSMLVRDLQHRVANLGVPAFYRGTDRPGFYKRLGATIYDQVTNELAVMQLVTLTPKKDE
jgi:predicted N-acetyltransferase YhbS